VFGNVAQYVALIAILCALIHGLLLPITVLRLLINKLCDVYYCLLCFLQNKFIPDIEQVTVFRHGIRMFANLCRHYAACAAKKLAECAWGARRWEENLNWQIQGCTVVASHLDNLHATAGKPLHLDKTKCNVCNFRSRSVSLQTASLSLNFCAANWNNVAKVDTLVFILPAAVNA